MPETEEKQGVKINRSLEKNIEYLNKTLGYGKSFDVVLRRFSIAGKQIALYFLNGFIEDNIMDLILHYFDDLNRSDIAPNTVKKLFMEHLNHVQVEPVDDMDRVIDGVLSGPLALLIDGEEQALVIDMRKYPGRNPQEPDLEKVVRGSRDGFVETVLFNSLLIRRRLRDPRLRMEIIQVGTRSKTDVVISYIEDIANPDLVKQVKNRLQDIKIDGLPMADKSIEELISPGSYWNIFPKVRYTERPDIATAQLLEGRVLVMVDTSPSVIITPCTFTDHLEFAEEYRQGPPVGVYIRWVRFIGIAVAVLLLPLWFLAVVQPDLLPKALQFIGPQKVGKIPLIGQFIMAELAVDMIRLATIHTPNALATATGIIAALLIGDIATKVGLFSPEVVMYTAVAAIGTFLIPSYEMSWALRIVRLFLLLAVAAFKLPGLLVGLVVVFIYMLRTKSFGVPYLWPFIPFNAMEVWSFLVRPPISKINHRPTIFKPQDLIRQAVPSPAKKPGRGGEKEK